MLRRREEVVREADERLGDLLPLGIAFTHGNALSRGLLRLLHASQSRGDVGFLAFDSLRLEDTVGRNEARLVVSATLLEELETEARKVL